MLKNALRAILTGQAHDKSPVWLEGLALYQEDQQVRVIFPHRYFAEWFTKEKKELFEHALRDHYGPVLPKILYENAGLSSGGPEKAGAAPCTDHGQAHPFPNYLAQTERQTFALRAPIKAQPKTVDKADANQGHDLTARTQSAKGKTEEQMAAAALQDGPYTFAAFISNSKNAFPLAAAKEIAENGAGEVYSPFLLCGPSGTGKSHLLRALATAFELRYPGRVVCEGVSRFCRDNALWALQPELFWQRCKVLLLDDLQELAGQLAWQQKLIACMDACPTGLGNTGRHGTTAGQSIKTSCQMVFTHAGSSQALRVLGERLRSRLESGLAVELMEPDLDVRLRYLQSRARQRGLSLNREQLLFLAQRNAQFRLLRGLLLKVEAFSALNGRDISPADMENIVRTGGAERPLGCRGILHEVARALNLRPEDILADKRRPDLVLARQLAMYICRQKLGLSYPELGRTFGGRDHSTVIHAIKKIQKLLVSDKDVQRLVTELEKTAF